jgi:diaminopimelate decarboxylase
VSTPPPFTLDAAGAREVAARFGTPVYVYDEATLRAAAAELLALPAPFGLSGLFAIKACSNRAVLRVFDDAGLGFDASSVWEAWRILGAGIDASKVYLTAQSLGEGFEDLVERGVHVTACSLAQIERYGRAFPGTEIALRINPGEGSGGNNRTNVAGPNASFGIWHELLTEARIEAERHGLTVTKAHHHVGSGGDPVAWGRIAARTLEFVENLPDVTTVNLGGGFKVARVPGETATDLEAVGREVRSLLLDFAERTGRKLRLQLEPGTYLTANAGVVVARVDDVVATGDDGHVFAKLDAGMPHVLRPAMYGAQHGIDLFPGADGGTLGAETDVVVVGPCCESGDILTPAPGDPEGLGPRRLPRPARGDFALIGGTGAYCASMAASNYNAIPAAPEVLRRTDGTLDLVRRRQTLDDVLREEVNLT